MSKLIQVLLFLNLLNLSRMGIWSYSYEADNVTSQLSTFVSYITSLLNVIIITFFSPKILRLLRNRTFSENLFLLLLFLSIMSIFWSVNFQVSTMIVVKLLLLYLVVKLSMDMSSKQIYDTFYYFTVFFVVFNLLTILLFPSLGIESSNSIRVGTWKGLMKFKTDLGIYSTFLILILLSFWSSNFNNKVLTSILILSLLILLIGSQSKISIVSLVLTLYFQIIVFIMQKIFNSYRRIVINIFGLLLIVVTLVIFESYYTSDIFKEELTFTGRTVIWSYLWQGILDSPIYGYGVGAYLSIDSNLSDLWSFMGWKGFYSAHSSFLEWGLSLGVTGFFIFSVLMFNILMVFINYNFFSSRGLNNLAICIPTILLTAFTTSQISVASMSWLIFFYLCQSEYNKKYNN